MTDASLLKEKASKSALFFFQRVFETIYAVRNIDNFV